MTAQPDHPATRPGDELTAEESAELRLQLAAIDQAREEVDAGVITAGEGVRRLYEANTKLLALQMRTEDRIVASVTIPDMPLEL